MIISIDQSGKIEETSQDTYIAFSNGKSEVIRISAKTKRRIQESFRNIGEPRGFMITTFAAALFALIKPHLNEIHSILIDTEYPGYEDVIVGIIITLIHTNTASTIPFITHGYVGKYNAAHKIANKARTGKRSPRIISYDELVSCCFDTKNGNPTLKYHFHKGR